MIKTLPIIICHLVLLHFSYAQNFSPQIDTSLVARNPETVDKAKSTVIAFINAMNQNNEKEMMDISALPFCIGEKQVITSKYELEENFKQIANQSKGKKYQIDTADVVGVSKEILNAVIPINVYYVIIKLKIFNYNTTITKSVLFGVQISDDIKIVGFH